MRRREREREEEKKNRIYMPFVSSIMTERRERKENTRRTIISPILTYSHYMS
jgi:hypothetical protein